MRPLRVLFGSGMPGMLRLAGAAAVAALALASVGAVLVYRTSTSEALRQQTHENCMELEALKGAIVLVFRDGYAGLVERRAELTAAEFARLRAYYDRQIARFPPDQCP